MTEQASVMDGQQFEQLQGARVLYRRTQSLLRVQFLIPQQQSYFLASFNFPKCYIYSCTVYHYIFMISSAMPEVVSNSSVSPCVVNNFLSCTVHHVSSSMANSSSSSDGV